MYSYSLSYKTACLLSKAFKLPTRKYAKEIFSTGLLLIVISLCCNAAENEILKSPNILLVLADDWSYPHAGVYGDKVVRTPNFDRLSREGILFTNAYSAAPSCTPSRAAILTGQYPHRLEEGANLHGTLPIKFPNYTSILAAAGYNVGYERKGWGPGNEKPGGYNQNPAGKQFESFNSFLSQVPAGTPFCYWFGSHEPHRPYEKGAGENIGLKTTEVVVPLWLPDVPEVRKDMLDYYSEIEAFDRDLGNLIKLLEEEGKLEETLIVITSDNGMPFPRSKANVYDAGTRVPLVVYWKNKITGGQVEKSFVNLIDLAPTFLEITKQKIPDEVAGKSLVSLFSGKGKRESDVVFLERERHANVGKGDLGYPCRAVRTEQFLYIRNFKPERWPGGDPEFYFSVGTYGDTDSSPSKQFVLANKTKTAFAPFFERAYAKRPAEELYDLRKDPGQLHNVANQLKYKNELKMLSKRLSKWMQETKDPRVGTQGDKFDTYTYYGEPVKKSN